jgi:AIPR protein
VNPLLQGLFKKFRETEELHSLKESSAFELFAASLVLSNDLLAQAERTDFLLDSNTIGIDVIAFEINGQLAWDAADVTDLCEASKRIESSIHFIQAKQSASVSSSEILSLGDTVRRFLNNQNYPGHPRLDALSEAVRHLFDNYATSLKSRPSVYLSFVTTASKASTTDNVVVERARTVEAHLVDLGFVGKVQASVLGADDLHELWTKKNHSNEVEIQLEKQVNLPKMVGVDQAILGVVSVAELLKLIENSDHSLDERVFYDNVRGFKGEDNPVNRQIMVTLASHERELLPVLNNGITVVASSYSPKPGDAVAV